MSPHVRVKALACMIIGPHLACTTGAPTTQNQHNTLIHSFGKITQRKGCITALEDNVPEPHHYCKTTQTASASTSAAPEPLTLDVLRVHDQSSPGFNVSHVRPLRSCAYLSGPVLTFLAWMPPSTRNSSSGMLWLN